MPLSSALLGYVHLHRLTTDSEWTFETAEGLVGQVLVPVGCESLALSDRSELQQSLGVLHSLELPCPDRWQISRAQANRLKQHRVEQEASFRAPFVDLHWWDDGPLHIEKVPIMPDFLLSRRSLGPRKPHNRVSEPTRVMGLIEQHGQGLAKITRPPQLVDNLHIAPPEQLADASLILLPDQIKGLKDTQAVTTAFFKTSPIQTIDLLDEDDDLKQGQRCTISPPLLARVPHSVKAHHFWSETSRGIVKSICDPSQKQLVSVSSPLLSEEAWNTIDHFPAVNLTPPPPTNNNSTKVSMKGILASSESAIDSADTAETEKARLEPVLFPRVQQVTFRRTNSFNPQNHMILKPPLDHEHAKGHSPGVSEGIEELLKHKRWDEEKIEDELFGCPDDLMKDYITLKKLKVQVPKAPPRSERIHAELVPAPVETFTLKKDQESFSAELRANLGIRRVEGLSSLNIELPWKAYHVPENLTMEELAGLGDGQEIPKARTPVLSEDNCSLISKRMRSESEVFGVEKGWPQGIDLLGLQKIPNQSKEANGLSGGSTPPGPVPGTDPPKSKATDNCGFGSTSKSFSSSPRGSIAKELFEEGLRGHKEQKHSPVGETRSQGNTSTASPGPIKLLEERKRKTVEQEDNLVGVTGNQKSDSVAPFISRADPDQVLEYPLAVLNDPIPQRTFSEQHFQQSSEAYFHASEAASVSLVPSSSFEKIQAFSDSDIEVIGIGDLTPSVNPGCGYPSGPMQRSDQISPYFDIPERCASYLSESEIDSQPQREVKQLDGNLRRLNELLAPTTLTKLPQAQKVITTDPAEGAFYDLSTEREEQDDDDDDDDDDLIEDVEGGSTSNKSVEENSEKSSENQMPSGPQKVIERENLSESLARFLASRSKKPWGAPVAGQ